MPQADSTLSPVNAVSALTEPLAASLGLYVWGVEIAFGPRSLVRVYVESEAEGGVDIDSCAKLSRLLGLSLEVEDIFPGAYVLEVSSPGLERVFFTPAQLAAYTGQLVSVTLKTAAEAFFGRRKFQGRLEADSSVSDPACISEDDAVFILNLDDPLLQDANQGQLRFAFADLKKARLVHIVPEKTLPGKKKKKNTLE